MDTLVINHNNRPSGRDTSNDNQSTTKDTTFLDIPAEVRVVIYQHVFRDAYMLIAPESLESVTELKPYSPPNLPNQILQTSKQIRSEAMPILQQSITLMIAVYEMHESPSMHPRLDLAWKQSLRKIEFQTFPDVHLDIDAFPNLSEIVLAHLSIQAIDCKHFPVDCEHFAVDDDLSFPRHMPCLRHEQDSENTIYTESNDVLTHEKIGRYTANKTKQSIRTIREIADCYLPGWSDREGVVGTVKVWLMCDGNDKADCWRILLDAKSSECLNVSSNLQVGTSHADHPNIARLDLKGFYRSLYGGDRETFPRI